MTNKDFILKLIKYCCFGLLLFGVFVLSFGCGFYYRDSGHTMQLTTQSLHVAPSDSISNTFVGSNIFLPTTFYNVRNDILYDISAVSCLLELSDNNLYFHFSFDGDEFSTRYTSYFFDTWNGTIRSTFDSPGGATYCDYSFFIDSRFNFNVLLFTLNTSTSFVGSSDYYSSVLTYYDINGYTFSIAFKTEAYNYLINSFYLSERTYYLFEPRNNDYYNNGYIYGYDRGSADGYDTGYNTGYNVGYDNGDLVGYQRGIEDSNQYTFLNLIGAVIDAPITAFVNLLDFNVFGFNMLNLCCSLLTLSLIILVVKFVLFRS